MLRAAINEWNDCLNEMAQGIDRDAVEPIDKLNLKAVSVLGTFFMLNEHTNKRLTNMIRAGSFSPNFLNPWTCAPIDVLNGIKMAKAVRNALHTNLPVHSYNHHLSRQGVEISVKLYADSGRGPGIEVVSAHECIKQILFVAEYAEKMWQQIALSMFADFHALCCKLNLEVVNAGGFDMCVGDTDFTNHEKRIELIFIPRAPLVELRILQA